MTWLYLLKERSKVSGVIELFHNELKTQSSTSICVLRTDNALEYMKNDVPLFCSKNEIIHQTSCPRRPKRMELRNANTDTS